ncbi:MAG: response regulator [Nostoc sp. S4]|nr:response regulator [Nostoc sp. S4]
MSWGESDSNSLECLVGIRILLVEDEPDIAELLTMILEAAGAQVMAFINAEAALDSLESLHPDILLCNAILPYHHGNWLIKQIRGHSSPYLRQLPAIAITSYTREFSINQALDAGFDRFLIKLESLEEIEGVIVELLSTHSYTD